MIKTIKKMRNIIYYIRFLMKKNINIGKKVNVELGTEIEISSKSNVKIGYNFLLKKNACIRCRENAELVIGNNVGFNNSSILTCRKKIKIGNNVVIGPNVMIFDHDHNYKSTNMINEFICEEINIGDNVWIGANSVILKGTVIGSNSVIAAGSIVKGKIEANSIFYNELKNKTKNIL